MQLDLTPADLGLPPTKFPAYRRGQAEIALDIAASDARFSMLSAPTGSGKSPICISVAQLRQARTLVLVATRGLQDQWHTDFATMGMRDVRGAQNYPCLAVRRGGELEGWAEPTISCNHGPCRAEVKCSLKFNNRCDYYRAISIAAQSRIVISNYAWWLAWGRSADPMTIGKFDLLVLDEAHTAPEWLTQYCAVELDRNEVRALLSMELPPIDEGVSVWAAWARQAFLESEARLLHAKGDMTGGPRAHVTRILRLTKMRRSLEDLGRAQTWMNTDGATRDTRMPGMETDWIAQDTPDGLKFSPVWAHMYSEKYLFRDTPHVILSSATLSPVIGKYLGIPADQSAWFEVKSGFNKRRRPFIVVPAARVDHRMIEGQVKLWVNRIDQIIEARQDRKGIIHSVSYARAAEIKRRSRFGHLMLTHDSRSARQVIEQYRRAKAPCILVSPAVVEGFDFPMDECRYQIVAKVPFPDGRDPLFKARKRTDENYGMYLASIAVMQMTGRSTRSREDASETFVVDEHFGWFSRRVKWPRWFKESWRWSKQVPPPIDISMGAT